MLNWPITTAATASAVASSAPPAIAASRVPEPRGLLGLVEPGLHEANFVAASDQRMSGGVVRLQFERLFEKRRCGLDILGLHQGHMGQSAQKEIIGVQTFGPLALERSISDRCRLGSTMPITFVGDLILQVEYVLQAPSISLGPQMRAGLGLDELRGDAQAIARLAHAALQHVAHAEFAPDLPTSTALPL